MENDIGTVLSPFGPMSRKGNGLIYYYKADNISIDKQIAEKLLAIVSRLDNSGAAKIIVIQGHHVEYSFEAQRILLTSKVLAKIAYVIQTETQYVTAELLKDIAKTFKSHIEVGVFPLVEEAEAWLLES